MPWRSELAYEPSEAADKLSEAYLRCLDDRSLLANLQRLAADVGADHKLVGVVRIRDKVSTDFQR